MTPDIDIIEYLRKRDRDLRSSRFDGQSAVLELVREARRLPNNQSESLVQALAQLVKDSDPDLLAFAIEFLAQDSSGMGRLQLEGLLTSARQSEEWFPSALLALLREGHEPIREVATDYVQRHSTEVDFPLALLTQLVAVAPEQAVQIGSSFLSRRLAIATPTELKSIAQAFVSAYLKHDQDCLIELVRSLREKNADLGKSFALALCDALQEPWIVKRIGPNAAEILANRMRNI